MHERDALAPPLDVQREGGEALARLRQPAAGRVVGEFAPDVAAIDLGGEVHGGAVVLGRRRQANGHRQTTEVSGGVATENATASAAVVIPRRASTASTEACGEIGDPVARAVRAQVGGVGGVGVSEVLASRCRPRENRRRAWPARSAPARSAQKVVVQRRTGQYLQRRLPDIGLIHHRRASAGSPASRFASPCRRRRACACADPAALRRRGAFPPRRTRHARTRSAGARAPPCRPAAFVRGQRLQIVDPGGGARRLQALPARAVWATLLFARGAPGPDLVDGEQLARRRERMRRAASWEEPAAQHRQRGRDRQSSR